MPRRLLLLLTTLLCAAPGAMHPSAQQAGRGQPPSVTFRTETNLVEIHAIVTDGQGAFVRDLTRDDFEIYEDGRLQKPAEFSLVDVPIARPLAPARGAEAVEPDVRATTRTFEGRIYVFLLDDLHTAFTRSLVVRDAARRFVQQYLGDHDLAAVVYTSGRQEAGQELTGSRRLLLAALDRFQGRKLPSAGAEKLAIHLRDASDDSLSSDTPQPARTSEGLQKSRAIRDPLDAERGLTARRALQAIENVANWLSDVRGRRKALLFFSEGIDYDVYEPFNRGSASSIITETREAVAAAQRANVNVYAVDPRGLGQFGELIDINARSDYPQLEYGTFRGALRELLLSQESLIALADETGGLAVVNAGDVAGGLGRIVLDNSRYYLLGYYSDTTRWSGRFLKIDVKVKRPGLTVRARRGYLPLNARSAVRAGEAGVKAGTSPALAAALSKPVPVGDLPFRVFAAPFKGTGTNGSVLLALEVDGQSLAFTERDGRFHEQIEVSILAMDHHAKVQGGDQQTFDLKLLPENYARVRRTGVRLLSRLELPPARYQIRVGAYEKSGGTIGTIPYDLEVPDYSKTPFALSGVFLASSADSFVTANQDARSKEALPLPPVATRRFSSAETLLCFVEVYDNSGRAAHAVTFAASVRDARDGRTVVETLDRRAVWASEGTRTHEFRSELPLKGLERGLYVLRIRAASTASGDSAQRDVPFEVR